MRSAGNTRGKMIDAAYELMKLKGYEATSFRDVWERAGTPRGSVYFHFPDGKEELGQEVLATSGRHLVAVTQEAGAASRTTREFIRALSGIVADQLEAENYRIGCPVMAVSLETANSSPALLAAADRAFASWRQAVVNELVHKGVGAEQAQDAAILLVSALEGARVMAMTCGSREPLDRVGAMLAAVGDGLAA
jgi:TetR/AcrR family transcriptional regulator, lmrAB and yxaGH operons repressor